MVDPTQSTYHHHTILSQGFAPTWWQPMWVRRGSVHTLRVARTFFWLSCCPDLAVSQPSSAYSIVRSFIRVYFPCVNIHVWLKVFAVRMPYLPISTSPLSCFIHRLRCSRTVTWTLRSRPGMAEPKLENLLVANFIIINNGGNTNTKTLNGEISIGRKSDVYRLFQKHTGFFTYFSNRH